MATTFNIEAHRPGRPGTTASDLSRPEAVAKIRELFPQFDELDARTIVKQAALRGEEEYLGDRGESLWVGKN